MKRLPCINALLRIVVDGRAGDGCGRIQNSSIMRIAGYMKKKRIVVFCILVVVCVIVFLLKNHNPFIGQYHSAEIMNGNTGEVYQIEQSRMEDFITELSALDIRISGAHLWTSGYQYRIILHRNNNEKDIFIYGEHDLQSGCIKYRTEHNILQTIAMYLE